MKVNLFIVLYLYILFFSLSAQVPLTTTTNTLRHGDIICKVEVPYVEAGERGEEVVNRDGTMEQKTHYYPYGGVIGDISTNHSFQKYKFEGKVLAANQLMNWFKGLIMNPSY